MHLLCLFVVGGPSLYGQLFHPENIYNPSVWASHNIGSDRRAFLRAMSEAWGWLQSENLIAHGPGSGYDYFVTRRGLELAKETDPVRRVVDEERLAPGLHPLIEARVRQQFLLGEYELAAFAALRQVEIRVRELAGAPESSIGVKLMQAAFKPDGGPLADQNLDDGERAATMALFWGAIGVFKNPPSHRQVDYQDPTQAAEVVLLADLLLRLLDEVETRIRRLDEHGPASHKGTPINSAD